MYTFQKFYDIAVINESLDTPVEFHLTDDTRLPHRIYGVFDLGEDKYGMSIEISDHDGIYLLTFHRILAKKPRKWSFKKPSHIRPCLSTLLKFVEACIPFIKSKMKGLIAQIPGKNADRYIRFAERLIKKTYISSFKVLPVKKSPDKKIYSWENLFITKIGMNPKSVFADKKFKAYDFSGQEDVLPHDVPNNIKPLFREKKTLKIEPSDKYKVGDLEIEEISIDSEVFDMISNIEKTVAVPKKEKSGNLLIDLPDNLSSSNESKMKSLSTKSKEEQQAVLDVLTISREEYIQLMTRWIREKLKDYPGDDINIHLGTSFEVGRIINNNIFDYGLKLRKFFENLVAQFNIGIYETPETEEMLKLIRVNPENTEEEKKDLEDFKKKIDIFEKEFPSFEEQIVEPTNVYETNIKPEQFVSKVPGSGTFEYNKNLIDMKAGFNVEDASVYKMLDYLNDTLNYKKEIREHEKLYSTKRYTGSSYKIINTDMRKSFSFLMDYKEDKKLAYSHEISSLKDKILGDDSYIADMIKMFDDITRLPEPLWVYRNTSLPNEAIENTIKGNDFVDPAFLSTSIDPKLDFSDSDGHRFRIFLPKGSNVIPILEYSEHPSEHEVILPPFSVLKPIRVDEYLQDGNENPNCIFTCVFIGSAFKDFKTQFTEFIDKLSPKTETVSENRNNRKTISRKQDKKYDPKDKYSSNIDPEILINAQKLFKNAKKNK